MGWMEGNKYETFPMSVDPDGVAIHTEEFAHFAGGVLGDSAVVTGAQAMAMTVIDLWTKPDLCALLSSEFAQVTSDIDVLA